MTPPILRPLTFAAFALAALALAPSAPAQIPGSPVAETELREPEAGDALSREAILARRSEVRGQIEELKPQIGAGARELAAEELAELERADRLLGLELGELRRAEELASAAPAAELGSPEERFGHPPPFSLSELDAVLDEKQAAAAAAALVEQQAEVSSRAADGARDQLEEAEQRLRLARDQAAEPTDSQRWQLRWLEAQVSSAQEQLRLRRLELENARRNAELGTSRAAGLERMAERVRQSLLLTDEEQGSILDGLAARGEELDAALATARRRTADAEKRLADAEKALEGAAEGAPAAAALAAARRLELDAAQIRQEVLSLRRERIERLGDLWRLRFRVLAGALAGADLAIARKSLEEDLEELERARRFSEVQLAERRLFLRLVNERLEASEDGSVRRRLGDQRDALEEMIALHEEELGELDGAARLVGRLRDEIAEQRGRITFGERWELLRSRLSALWSYEIATAEDRPITVGKVVVALFLIVLGLVVAKAVSRRLGRSVFPRLGLARGAAAAFQTLVFYFLLVVFVFWALRLVSIPLTVFTVLGGVLAIGIGFGSQNIVNNFISGLIILAERPIKVGDLIDVDGIFGKVERIGPRSSQIRSGDNTHVIVPNSAFLEKNVLNWTMSDDVVRTSVDVGVAYGSPVETVAELLRRAVDEEPKILAEPAPEVLFTDFGDNALIFRAYFWVRVTRPLDRHRAQSRLRFRIDALFHDAGVVIAFPQRDVHLDSQSPVEVRVVRPGRGR